MGSSVGGCPVTVWDGPYSFRCGLGEGVGNCAYHGPFRACPDCDGLGQFVHDERSGWLDCPTCHSTGRVRTARAQSEALTRSNADRSSGQEQKR